MILKNTLRLLTLTSCLFLAVSSTHAEWLKIDDFEADDLWEKWAMNSNLTEMYSLAIVDQIPDPLDPDNRVLFVNSNAFETNLWDQTSLFNTSAPHIPDGTEATLYFRLFRLGTSDGYVVGFISERTPEPVFDTVDDRRIIAEPQIGWTQYEAYMRPRDTSWEVYDTNGFRRIEDFSVEAGYWYEIWMHIINRPGATGGDEYAVYFQRSDESEPTRLLIPSSDGTQTYETALFRNQADFAVTNFGMSHTMDSPAERNAGNPQYWDDFHMDTTGLNLTRPEGVTVAGGSLNLWNGLSITDSGGLEYVNTGDQLGWLAVNWDPYLWSESVASWIYVQTFRSFGPLWVYFWPTSDGSSPIPQPTDPEMVLSDPEDPNSELIEGDLVYVLVPGLNKWAYVPEYTEGAPMWAFLF